MTPSRAPRGRRCTVAVGWLTMVGACCYSLFPTGWAQRVQVLTLSVVLVALGVSLLRAKEVR